MENLPGEMKGSDGWRPLEPIPFSPNKFYYKLTSNYIITVEDEAVIANAASECISLHGRPRDNLPPHLLVTRPNEPKFESLWHKAPPELPRIPDDEAIDEEDTTLITALQTLLACGRPHVGFDIKQQLLNEHASLEPYQPNK